MLLYLLRSPVSRVHLILLVLLGWLSHPSAAQLDLAQVRFSHLSAKNGLSSDWVLSVVMDKRGYLWVGTNDGLNRYDGYQVKVYRRNRKQAYSLGGNRILHLHEDRRGQLWVGTDGTGLYRYDAQNDHFVGYPEIGNIAVRSIDEDRDGHLWISTDNHPTTGRALYRYQADKACFVAVGQFSTRLGMSGMLGAEPGYLWLAIQREGVAKMDTRSGKIVQRYQHDPANSASLGSNDVKQLFEHRGQIWVATYDNAVSVLDPVTGRATHFPARPDDPAAITYPHISGISVDTQGRIWVGSSGVWIYDPATRQAGRLKADPNQADYLRDLVITTVYRDPQGRMWVGTQYGGLSVYDPLAYKFAKLGVTYQNPVTNAIGQDQQKRLWLGTEAGFVVAARGPNGRFIQLPSQEIGNYSQSVLSLHLGTEGQMWAGTWASGLLLWDTPGRTFRRFANNPDVPTSLASNNVYGLAHEPARQRLWLATWGGGLAEMDLTKNTFKHYQPQAQDTTSIASSSTTGLWLDEAHCWVTSNNGLSRLDKQTGKFTRFNHEPANPKSLAAKRANCIYRDRQGTLWVGTQGGLSKLTGEGEFTNYTIADGLPSDAVVSILEDDHHCLWLGTTVGLAKLDPATNQITTYSEADGLLSNQFNNNSAFRDDNGYLFFGGLKGVNFFHPDSLKTNPRKPRLYLTELKIFNQPVNIGDYDSLLKQDISFTSAISLTYKQSVFSLDFVALNFTKPEKNQYAYYLDGFEKDWNYVGTKRTATYTNLPPGDYVFRLKASNNDGLWDEQGLALHIHVAPPWWATWWARLGGLLLLAGGAISYYRYRMAAVQKKNAQLEKAVALRTAELQKTAQDLERTAHELRTASYQIQEKNEELLCSEEELRQNMEELQANQEVISQQKEHLSQSLAEIYRKNQMILDSIHYAKSIQATILPNEDQLAAALGRHFVLLWPKDIVSGDFYWLAPRIEHQTEAGQPAHTTLFAVVDCTGHGVPGAFMSLIGHTTLNEVVAQAPLPSPGPVLAELNQRISLALKQTGSSLWQNHDGMDMALCALTRTPEAAWLTFAGARRPLWVARKATGQLEFIRLAGTRSSIAGGNQLNDSQFEEHKLDLLPGDTLYLFTDGLTDQNNPERQKFGYTNLQKVLSHSQGLGLPLQKDLLASALTEFMAGAAQRDDITLLAVEV
jgi:ligand-binding sensor domain-containing protein/serine phosphatase RsbU (regulator of sigma subunit)